MFPGDYPNDFTLTPPNLKAEAEDCPYPTCGSLTCADCRARADEDAQRPLPVEPPLS